ncbi:MAG: hypothetical protein Q8L68_06025, partial [Methylococcales bacterium]|nr:hypothetical protein [Methylococcales bacterium]
MPSKELHIVVIGNNHADYSVPPVLMRLLTDLAKRKIACGCFLEGPSDQSITTTLESTERGRKQNRIFKTIAPTIVQYYKKDPLSQHLYFSKEAHNKILEIIRTQVAPLFPPEFNNEGSLRQMCLEMYRDTTYEEEIKLLETIKRLQIPFAGIDADTETFTRQTTAAAASEQAYCKNELTRIATMVNNIFIQVDQGFQNGGIIFISVGRNHAHRLAANLLQQVVTQKGPSIQVHAFSLESRIAEEFMVDFQHAIRLTDALDSSDIQEIYK